jgi:hypothetical protein
VPPAARNSLPVAWIRAHHGLRSGPPRVFAGALTAFSVALLYLGALTPAALASNGHGFYGATDDKVVTYAGFSLIAFFTVFVIVMSTIQGRLDRRKEERKAAARVSMANGRWRGGW